MKYGFPLSDVDATRVYKANRYAESKRHKREYIKAGYIYQLSLYGVISKVENDDARYCRIEVMSNTPFTERLIVWIYDFFSYVKPANTYTIWLYDVERKAIKQVGEYD